MIIYLFSNVFHVMSELQMSKDFLWSHSVTNLLFLLGGTIFTLDLQSVLLGLFHLDPFKRYLSKLKVCHQLVLQEHSML